MQIKRDHVVIASIMLLAAIASIVLAWMISINSAQIEIELLDELSRDELEELATMVQRDPSAPLPRTDMVEVWLQGHWDSEELPEIFDTLEIGKHRRVNIQGRDYHVLHDIVAGREAIIAIDLTPFQERRATLRNLLLLFALLAPMATVTLTIYYLTRRLTPVINMAREVADLDPSERGVRLSQKFNDGEMRVIANAFDTYQERLDQFVEREQSFCEAASHELRTPLATLSAGTELLVAESANYSAGTALTIDRMQRTALHMSSLLNGLMWLVREQEVPSYEVVNLGDVAGNLAEQYEPLIEQKSLCFTLNKAGSPTVNIPVGHFEIVLGNILRNAIQHTPAGGSIDVHFSNASIVIKDSGTGIDSRFLDQIFRRDFRGRDSRGGLGLFLSQRICLFHTWKLSIYSENNMGTTVIIDLTNNACD